MKKFGLITVACSVLFISGCDHYNTIMASLDAPKDQILAISPASGSEMTFRNHLAREYYQLAEHEKNVTMDYRAVKRYENKIELLSENKMPDLGTPKKFDLDDAERSNLKTARSELMNALKSYRYVENREPLAKAFSSYDCWLDEAEESTFGKPMGDCKTNFRQAMNSLVVPYQYVEDDEYYEEDDFFDFAL